MTSSPLIERLEARETQEMHFATNRTAPIITCAYDKLINPDGPEAAALIRRYEQALEAIVRGDHLRSQACDDTEAAAAIARSALRSKASTNDR